LSAYELQQAKREIGMLRDLQRHVLDVSKRILIQQKINRLESEIKQEKEKNRSAKRSSLRSRLRNLVMSIITQN
jgi:uncharacterized UPF0146 family protein